jgi:hypothetical protein
MSRTPITDVLTTEQAAELAGLRVETFRRYRSRGTVPEPDGYLGRTPWWRAETITKWAENRRRKW